MVLASVVAMFGSSELQRTITVRLSAGNRCRLAENPEVDPLCPMFVRPLNSPILQPRP
jgi:hypothetical protein